MNEVKRKWSVLVGMLMVLAWGNGVFAQAVSEEMARSVAETFFNYDVRDGQNQPVYLEDITAETPFQNFYIFSADSGFVMVAADERVTPILGYSKTNRFVTEDMPENLRWWLESYDEQIQDMRESLAPFTSEIAMAWRNLKAGERMLSKGNRSEVLDLTTKWDQGGLSCLLYNNACPVTNSGHRCVTGCTATAIAQALKYWDYPIQGIGNKMLNAADIFFETVMHPECYPISVDFSATTYDWQNMPDQLTCSSSQAEIDAVATLMLHCGVAMHMNYGLSNNTDGGSSAPYLVDTISKYFDYSPCAFYTHRSDYSDDEWINMLKTEIDSHRPVLYRGSSAGGGHAFVFYGYDDNDMFLVNWGWSGQSDGYYAIGELNPPTVGIGGGTTYDFNENNAAIFYLMPNDRTLSPPTSFTVNNTANFNELQLEWSATLHATSYVILRNGEFLAETSLTSYTDGDIASGSSNTYQIITIGENHRASLPSGSVTYTKPFIITTTAFPMEGGTTSGDGHYPLGESCTVTATPNPGFAFMGWYNNALGSILYSRQPEYTFTVTHDRNLVAKFVPGNYAVTTSCSPSNGGTVSGNQGTYTVGSTVTLTATANTGYVFSCWTEDGQVLSNQPTYSFQIRSDRHLVANFMNLSFSIGDVITNPDGSKGVVFYINPTYTGGCMVALEDVSTGCQWGNSGDIPFLRNYARTEHEERLSDLDGYANTTILRDYQAANANYASGKVDYDHGWYVPSAGQLRKIFSALPFIENAITNAGGAKLVSNASYWSSTERSETNAWIVGASIEMLNTYKTSNCRLRAVHDFSINNTMRIDVGTNDVALGSAVGSGFYNNGATVTVTATPTGDNLFRGWTEAGHLVSQDPVYTFSANSNRKLVANFAIRGGIGTLVTNPDGSQGILFHLNEDGSQGLMVALNDASVGCQWGTSSDIAVLKDRSYNIARILEDQSGYRNTQLIRLSQGTNNGYAASIVDFDNGWYLPSAGQLRKLYATLPVIEEAILRAGGSIMTGDKYWSSTEYSATYASTPGFGISNTYKTSNCRVRAIRNYIPDGDYVVLVSSNNENYGSVSGSGTFALNQTVTVTATPNEGYQFDHWTEDGAIVSYDAVYQFPFTRSRSLVAHFVVPGTVGSVITNADGSRGVVFYTDLSGNSLMVALEDVSSGCAWGANQDITTLENLNPSQTQNMLNDMNGYANTQTIRNWQSNNSNYAAGKVDFANKWYLPSAGEMRKLYAALPLIEEAIVSAGGSVMTGDSYWSSSENSSSQAWSPSFEFTKAYKTNNLRVRAIRRIVPQMMIAATANPEEGGTVSGAGAYDSGATCTLTATPNEHFAFVNWTENGVVVSTNATYSFTVTGNRTLVANFELNTYNVVIFINPSEGGMVTGAGTYNYGETCTLVATANEGYTFINWTKNGQSVSTNLAYSFTVTENVDFVANFTPNTYEITATATPTDGGIVTGTGAYNYGFTCTLTATENIGYHFVNWTLGGVVVSNTQTYTFTVTEAADYTANFELNTYEITATANPTGGGTVTGAGTYNHGATATLAATANTGYTFVNWTKDGQQVSTSASYSFTVTGSGAYIANFEPDICIVTVTANPSEGGTVTGSGTYDYGTQVTLTATASEGYTFVNWTANGALLSTSPTCTFTVTGDTDCVARFLSGDGIVQTGSFTSGWNWWNTYIEQGGMDGLQMLEDGLGSNGIQIKSQQQYVNYYEGMGWMGMLSAIDNESTYKIKTNAACTVDMVGLETTSGQHPITVGPGWNWIGYPVNSSMSVATAFSNVTPASGDQVKAQNGYANYYDGMGWMGTLSTIEPGMGILYKSNGGTNFTLVYPEGAKGETLEKNITAEGNYWVPDMTAYPNNMTVTAVVELDDVELASDNYEIGVFANGECRGSARLMYVEPLNRYMAFLTITGEDVVDLNFGLYNTMTGEVETCQGASLWYETNAIVGSVLEPYVIRFRGTMGMDEWATSVDVFPNPVTSGEIIHISLPMVETLHASSVQIVNALGQVVETRCATSLQTIVAPSVAGVYTLRITVEGKETCYRKLIVR